MDFSSLDAGSAAFKDSTFSWFTIRSSLLTLQPRRLELIARLPSNWLGQTGRLPSQRESKPRHRRIGDEIHPGIILIARLVIVLLRVFAILRQPPGLLMALELHAFIDREPSAPDPCHTEMIGAIIVSRLRPRIRTHRQPEFFRRRHNHRVKRSPLRPRNLHLLRRSQRLHAIVGKIQRNLPRRNRRMLPQILRPEQPLLLPRHPRKNNPTPRLQPS